MEKGERRFTVTLTPKEIEIVKNLNESIKSSIETNATIAPKKLQNIFSGESSGGNASTYKIQQQTQQERMFVHVNSTNLNLNDDELKTICQHLPWDEYYIDSFPGGLDTTVAISATWDQLVETVVNGSYYPNGSHTKTIQNSVFSDVAIETNITFTQTYKQDQLPMITLKGSEDAFNYFSTLVTTILNNRNIFLAASNLFMATEKYLQTTIFLYNLFASIGHEFIAYDIDLMRTFIPITYDQLSMAEKTITMSEGAKYEISFIKRALKVAKNDLERK